MDYDGLTFKQATSSKLQFWDAANGVIVDVPREDFLTEFKKGLPADAPQAVIDAWDVLAC